MAAATRDRDGLRTGGEEQWYPVASGQRIYRHTLVGVDASGYLVPLADAAGLDYVGVANAAIFLGGGAGDGQGERSCPVIQEGELQFLASGTPDQSWVGQVAYAVDDQMVTTDDTAVSQGYAVGRVAKVASVGGAVAGVRVNITGWATSALLVYLGSRRKRFTVGPQAIALSVSKNYRLGVTLPTSFGERTYCAELVCTDAAVGAKVVINRDTSRKTASYCEWNLYVPPDAPGVASGSLTFSVLAYCAGEGWPLVATSYPGTWDTPTEIL